jgi:hypothetical protein
MQGINVNNRLIFSFFIIFFVYIVKYDIYWFGNGYYESTSVFFRSAFLNTLKQSILTLDNGYFALFPMLFSVIFYKIFNLQENFFIAAQIFVGVSISLFISLFNLKVFEIYILDASQRFFVSVFLGIVFLLSGPFGDFTYFHNFCYALFPVTMLIFLLPSIIDLKKLTLFLFSTYILFFLNSKPYFVIFLPIAVICIFFVWKKDGYKKNILFYLFSILAGSLQFVMIILNKGSGVSSVTIEGYSIFYAILDSFCYLIATYSFLIFHPIQNIISNFYMYNVFSFLLFFIMIFSVFLWYKRSAQNKKIFIISMLNLFALGSLFVTLYGATFISHFPRFVFTLSDRIPIENTRHFLGSNFAAVLTIFIVFSDIIRIFFAQSTLKRYTYLLRPVVFIFILGYISMSGLFQNNWYIYTHSRYIVEHSPAYWKKDFPVFASKDKPFFILNGADPGAFNALSDFSNGMGWLNLDNLEKKISDKNMALKLVPKKLLQSKVNAVLVMPDLEKDYLTSKKSAAISPLNRTNSELKDGKLLRVLKKDFVKWRIFDPYHNFDFYSKPYYFPIVGTKLDFYLPLNVDDATSYRLYFQPSCVPYTVEFYSYDNHVLYSGTLMAISPYDIFRNYVFLPILQILSGSLQKIQPPISWINIDGDRLKNFSGKIRFFPDQKIISTNEDTKITLFTLEDKTLFLRDNYDIATIVFYDKQGKRVGLSKSIGDRGSLFYKYFYFDEPVQGAVNLEILNKKNEPILKNFSLIYIGNN